MYLQARRNVLDTKIQSVICRFERFLKKFGCKPPSRNLRDKIVHLRIKMLLFICSDHDRFAFTYSTSLPDTCTLHAVPSNLQYSCCKCTSLEWSTSSVICCTVAHSMSLSRKPHIKTSQIFMRRFSSTKKDFAFHLGCAVKCTC